METTTPPGYRTQRRDDTVAALAHGLAFLAAYSNQVLAEGSWVAAGGLTIHVYTAEHRDYWVNHLRAAAADDESLTFEDDPERNTTRIVFDRTRTTALSVFYVPGEDGDSS